MHQARHVPVEITPITASLGKSGAPQHHGPPLRSSTTLIQTLLRRAVRRHWCLWRGNVDRRAQDRLVVDRRWSAAGTRRC
jgi:hypothetical protein